MVSATKNDLTILEFMTWEFYQFFTWGWIAIAIIIFVVLLFITAPYGRHTKTTWGPLISNKLGWFFMEFFLLITLGYFIYTGENTLSIVNAIILTLIGLHYINRSLIFPLRIKTKGKKMPLVIALMGLFFNVVNGFLFGYYLGNFKEYSNDWLTSPQFIIGLSIFFIGGFINWKSDGRLIRLRKESESGYKIPQNGWFNYVSCPNLLGEIIEWLGFAILTWSLPGIAFFVWTFANLAPRAIAHHKWYRSHFEDYPKNRKALIPFLW